MTTKLLVAECRRVMAKRHSKRKLFNCT